MIIDIIATESVEPFAPYHRFPVLFKIKDNLFAEWVLFNTPWCISKTNKLPRDTHYLLDIKYISYVVIEKLQDICTYQLAYETLSDVDSNNLKVMDPSGSSHDFYNWMIANHKDVIKHIYERKIINQKFETINMFKYLSEFHTNNPSFNLFVVK